MTLKEKIMKDSWDYDFPMSNIQAEKIVDLIEKIAINFLESIKNYELESGNVICHDERESKELFEIFIEKNKL